MTETELNLIETEKSIILNEESKMLTAEQTEEKLRSKQAKINKVGFAALIIGLICFVWAFVNITLFSRPVAPTGEFGTTTPIFTAKLVNNSVLFSLTVNGILFTIINLVLFALSITFFIVYKDLFANLRKRLVDKSVFITTITLSSIVLLTYLLMFIIGFIPPHLSILLTPENGQPLTSNFNALFNWNTRLITTKNAGYWIVCVLFAISLSLFITTIILYFGFEPINTKCSLLNEKLAAKKQERIQARESNKQDRFSLRELFAKAREAKRQAKAEKLANNSLKQNLADVNVDIQSASIQPEIIEIDQHGTANQTFQNEMPKIEQDQLTGGVDKSEPRRLGKFFADIKNKKKSKGTNINKKATVAAPTQEINDLVKQLMPD